MSYEHCDIHDEDGTNGCRSCEQERVEGMSDRACVLEAAGCVPSGPFYQPGPMHARVREIANTLQPAAKSSATRDRREIETMDKFIVSVESWDDGFLVGVGAYTTRMTREQAIALREAIRDVLRGG